MTRNQGFKFALLLVFIIFAIENGIACSGYKITIGNTTVFASNEDAWRLTPHIWFEIGNTNGRYGAAFTGSRYDGDNGYAPQAGMNEAGLAFERLASYHPKSENFSDRITISNPTKYLKDILHSCKTVEEVKDYISRYDYSYFIDDVFIYADKSGKYLIVEPYSMKIGNNASYVFSNFCPSITSEKDALHLERYKKGVEFLKNKIDTSLVFCTALSDTMHVCRKKIGDGTLLTSIWNLNNGIISLFFYHNYKNVVQFDIKKELAKGDHIIALKSLFPHNEEFEKLKNYKIPKNSILIAVFIVANAALFLFTSVFFLILFFRRKSNTEFAYLKLLLFPLSLIMFLYMYVLSGSINVFYFPSPYYDPSNLFKSLSSYIPFVLLLLIIPLIIINYRLFKEKLWSVSSKGLFALNNIVYIILIGLFFYWGFYNVFG